MDVLQEKNVNYKNITLPFNATRRDFFIDIELEKTLDEFMDVVLTYSPVHAMMKKKNMSLDEARRYILSKYREFGVSDSEERKPQKFARLYGMAVSIKK